MYKYKVYELKEDGEVGNVIDETNDCRKWQEKADNFEVLISITKEYRRLMEQSA